MTIKDLREILYSDLKAYGVKDPNIFKLIKLYFGHSGAKAVILYRLSNFFYHKGFKYIPKLFMIHSIKVTGCEINFKAQIGKGLIIPHPVGIVIGPNIKIGDNLFILQGVTIGIKDRGYKKGPQIGNNVRILAGAKVIGEIFIGDNVVIGANSVVISDIPDNTTVAGVPAKVIKQKTGV